MLILLYVYVTAQNTNIKNKYYVSYEVKMRRTKNKDAKKGGQPQFYSEFYMVNSSLLL